MIPKNFDVIELEDIQALKNDGRPEDRTIEYKSQFPTNAESQKIPYFLKPVCSFANTDGGDLILGIEEKKGIPKNICGVNLNDPDSDKLRLEHFIETGIESNTMLITCGLPVTCKTPIAERISKAKGHHLLRTDLIRREVLKNEDIFDEKVASDMDNRTAVYEEALRIAEGILANSEGVIIDATFITQPLRKRAAALANRYGRTFVILETDCPSQVSLERIRRRTREDYESNALTEQAYTNNKKIFEKVDIGDIKQLYPNLDIVHCIVDTRYDAPEDWHVIKVEEM